MKNDRILTHQTIRIKARIRTVDGDLVDPQSIEFELKRPDSEVYVPYDIIGARPVIIKEEVGIYYIDIDIDIPGIWQYSWFTYGYPETSWKGFFQAENARYI